MQACGCKIMTPRYAVWQNAQQLPLFLQGGEPPQRKPWLAFLVGFWLVLVGSWLAFWLVWFGFWLAFWLAFWLVWLGFWLAFWLAFWLVWLGFWLAPGWLSGWFGWLFGWFGLAFFFSQVFLARLAETQLLGILQAYLGVIILQPHACMQRF